MRKVLLNMNEQQKYEIIKSLVEHNGNKGRKPAHTFSDAKRNEIITLYNNKYRDATFSYACELLEQHDGISISPSALTNILYGEYIPSPRSSHKTKKRMAKESVICRKTLSAKKRLPVSRAVLFLWKIPIPDVLVVFILGK